jgi:hypothetical protein
VTNYEDVLVGLVAAGLGTATLLAGVLNWEWTFQYRPVRWIEAAYGRGPARIFYALLGLTMIGLGLAIFQGWVLFRAAPRSSAAEPRAQRAGSSILATAHEQKGQQDNRQGKSQQERDKTPAGVSSTLKIATYHRRLLSS